MRRFNFFARRKDDAFVNELAVQYEGALRANKVYSLPFQATQLENYAGDRSALVAVATRVCRAIGAELMVFGQVVLDEGCVLSTYKRESTWLPQIAAKVSERSRHKVLADLAGSSKEAAAFLRLLRSLKGLPGVYEIAPGLALFYLGDDLSLTATAAFIKALNNE